MFNIKKTAVLSGATLIVATLFFVFCGDEGTPDYCGDGHPLNTVTQFCFEGATYNKCGGQEYNPTMDFCHNSQLHPLCNGNDYHPTTHFCWVADGTTWPRCEGGQSYNPHTEGCGSDNFIRQRCGRSLFDPAVEFCHEARLVYDRCNGMAFNPSSQCNGVDVQPKCREIYYNPDVMFCWDDRTYMLCRGQEWDPANGNPCETNIDMVTVISENADATGGGRYAVGAMVQNISAGTDTGNRRFMYWLVEGLDVDTIKERTTGFVMPANPVILTAVFRDWIVGTFIDSRDNRVYRTVTIGTQTWMAENLNFNAIGSACNEPVADNCSGYGRHYEWATAMNIDASYNSTSWGGSDVNQQGICPTGWHLPSRAEWETLIDYVDGSSIAGSKLRSEIGWFESDEWWWRPGTDDFGFSALPSEGCWLDGSYHAVSCGGVGCRSVWWTATQQLCPMIDIQEWGRVIWTAIPPSSGSSCLPVRCVRDD